MGIKGEFALTIDIKAPQPPGPDGASGDGPGDSIIGPMLRWERAVNQLTGGGNPVDKILSPQEVQNATQKHVISIPMVLPQDRENLPALKNAPLEPELIPAAPDTPIGRENLSAAPTAQQTPSKAVAAESPTGVALSAPPPTEEAPAEAPSGGSEGPAASVPVPKVPPSEVPPVKEAPLNPEETIGLLKKVSHEETPNPREQSQLEAAAKAKIQAVAEHSPAVAEFLKNRDSDQLNDVWPSVPPWVWFAAIAHGGRYKLSFSQGYSEDPKNSTDFGYEESIIGCCGTGALIGMQMTDALSPGYGAVNGPGPLPIGTGPGTYSACTKNGNLVIDLTKNNAGHDAGGNGPKIFPTTDKSYVCVCIITTLARNGSSIAVPPNWLTIDQFTHLSILGTLCVGKVPNGATKLTFLLPGTTDGPRPGCAALIACTQVIYSPAYQHSPTVSGQVPDPWKPKSVKLQITPHIPQPWPYTQDTGKIAYAAPKNGGLAPPKPPPPVGPPPPPNLG